MNSDMNILFDFITLQQYTGAGEYVRRVLYEVIKKKERLKHPFHIFALYDSKKGIVYDDVKNINCITFLDIKNKKIDNIIEAYNIRLFFIGCAQYIGSYKGVENIKCKVLCVVHDLCDEEFFHNKILTYIKLSSKDAELPIKPTFKDKIRQLIFPNMHLDNFSNWYISCGGNKIYKFHMNRIPSIIQLFHNNPNVEFIAVSRYTKASIIYNYNIPSDKINVLYSPERTSISKSRTVCESLKKLIEGNKKYFLFVSSNRKVKNIDKTINAFRIYSKRYHDYYLATIGYEDNIQFKNHIILPFLSDYELQLAYSHCYALIYPSFFEGFGYPPIEAMRYKKPVLCSNTTSMPEILGDAPIYFSPLYETAIYYALTSLQENNYKYYSQKSHEQYNKIHNIQKQDLNKLTELIFETA